LLAWEDVDKLRNATGKGVDLIAESANSRIKQSAELVCEAVRSGLAIETCAGSWGDFRQQFFISGMRAGVRFTDHRGNPGVFGRHRTSKAGIKRGAQFKTESLLRLSITLWPREQFSRNGSSLCPVSIQILMC